MRSVNADILAFQVLFLKTEVASTNACLYQYDVAPILTLFALLYSLSPSTFFYYPSQIINRSIFTFKMSDDKRERRAVPGSSNANAGSSRASNAIGLAKFGKKRSTWDKTKAKTIKTKGDAMQLKKYRSALKKEGYEAGTGISRKRERDGEDASEDTVDVGKKKKKYSRDDWAENEEEASERKSSASISASNTVDKQKQKKQAFLEKKGIRKPKTGGKGGEKGETKSRVKRSDPLAKAKAIGDLKRAEKQKEKEAEEGKAAENVKKGDERKKKAKKMMERTRRGQPKMKNMIGDLLSKIKSTIAEDETGSS
jgi:hypothetical protein